MRFLADENLDRHAGAWLARAGHDVTSAPKGLADKAVGELARAQRRALLTHDRDFTDPSKFPPSEFPGIVLLALLPPTLERVVKALENVLSKIPPQSFPGKLIVVSETDAFEIFPPGPQSAAFPAASGST